MSNPLGEQMRTPKFSHGRWLSQHPLWFRCGADSFWKRLPLTVSGQGWSLRRHRERRAEPGACPAWCPVVSW